MRSVLFAPAAALVLGEAFGKIPLLFRRLRGVLPPAGFEEVDPPVPEGVFPDALIVPSADALPLLPDWAAPDKLSVPLADAPAPFPFDVVLLGAFIRFIESLELEALF